LKKHWEKTSMTPNFEEDKCLNFNYGYILWNLWSIVAYEHFPSTFNYEYKNNGLVKCTELVDVPFLTYIMKIVRLIEVKNIVYLLIKNKILEILYEKSTYVLNKLIYLFVFKEGQENLIKKYSQLNLIYYHP